MSNTLPTPDLQEIQRLLRERAQKKHELDALDKAIESHLGVTSDVRPARPVLSAKNFKEMALGGL